MTAANRPTPTSCSSARSKGATTVTRSTWGVNDSGVVVGATAEHGLDLSTLSGAVLAPGLGAQGATPADLAARFAGVRGVVLPTASRSVLAAGPNPARVRAAAQALRDQLTAAQSPLH